ncbi:MAG: hypothetical protein ACYCW6_19450 [Candidatus Xenobia bacterium]
MIATVGTPTAAPPQQPPAAPAPAAAPTTNIADTVEFKDAVQAAVAEAMKQQADKAVAAAEKPKDPSRTYKLLGAIGGAVVGAAAGSLMVPGLASAGYLGVIGGLKIGEKISSGAEGTKFEQSPMGQMLAYREYGQKTGDHIFPRWVAAAGCIGAVAAFGVAWSTLSPVNFWSTGSQLLGMATTSVVGARLGAQLCTVKE